MKKKLSCLLLAGVLAFAMAGCSQRRFLKDSEIAADVTEVKGTITIEYYFADSEDVLRTKEVDFVLDYQKAPNTVANFYALAKAGEYDGKLVSQPSGQNEKKGVILAEKFYDYATDDDGNKTEEIDYDTSVTFDPGYHIIGEFSKNGWEKNDNEMEGYGYLYMVLSDENDYNSAAAAFGVSLITDDKNSDGSFKSSSFGKTHCIFGSTQDGFFLDIASSSDRYVFSGEKAMRIKSISFDQEYDLTTIHF